ncbi:DUF429 domain-containing protein [Corynebacterium sp. Q4381]|uniref:DUF429 domain-containing protein n=1 Tax=Corynebacterium sp. Marseille-Q4381 TaxID=3121597 RepID=UPI002FE69FAE
MIFSGIDLAADPAKTGAATLKTSRKGPVLVDVHLNTSDFHIFNHVLDSDLTGIDAPLGWPRLFRRFINDHAAGDLVSRDVGTEERRELANRFTDLEVRRVAGVVPLPVAAERIAFPVMRWAGVEAQLRDELGSEGVRRDGFGRVAEVYPAAALKMWGLRHRGYKGGSPAAQEARVEIVASLARERRLDWAGFEDAAVYSADCLDAVIVALVASEISAGACVPPPKEHESLILEEGWIWIPRPD